jgi:hypothetical protein
MCTSTCTGRTGTGSRTTLAKTWELRQHEEPIVSSSTIGVKVQAFHEHCLEWPFPSLGFRGTYVGCQSDPTSLQTNGSEVSPRRGHHKRQVRSFFKLWIRTVPDETNPATVPQKTKKKPVTDSPRLTGPTQLYLESTPPTKAKRPLLLDLPLQLQAVTTTTGPRLIVGLVPTPLRHRRRPAGKTLCPNTTTDYMTLAVTHSQRLFRIYSQVQLWGLLCNMRTSKKRRKN